MRWINGMTGLGGDDSLRLQAEGFWNDSAVSSHGGGSVYTHRRAVAQQTTDVLYSTTVQRGSVFTHDPPSWNPPKHY